MNVFRTCLETNYRKDLGAEGFKLTWNNKRHDGFTEELLGRCISNLGWRQMFEHAAVENVIWDVRCPFADYS